MKKTTSPMAYSYLRMSTDIQLRGDSKRRQLANSRDYAKRNGLVLAEQAELQDIGVSAFKGKNVKHGALGEFVAAVESGRVPKGSYLLVEALDRLSRQQPLEAQSLFLRILTAGIYVVTLIDSHVYGPDVSTTDLIVSLLKFSAGHEESEKKSFRLGEVWKNKRAAASAQKPMTARCPAWLRLSPDRQNYEVIPERAAIVQRIFEEAASGIGAYAIASRLIGDAVPSFGRSKGWHKSYVVKILSNRAVLGEFQPHVLRDGDRAPDGEPIAGYFPRLIDDALFYRVQSSRSLRRTGAGGRKGKFISNLFSGLAKCGHCQGSMIYENKGAGPKGGNYLVCDNAKRKLGCSGSRWRYEHFEKAVLTFVKEIELSSIRGLGDTVTERVALEAEVAALSGELDAVQRRMEQTYQLLDRGTAVDFVSEKLREQGERLAKLKSTVSEKADALAGLNNRANDYETSRSDVKELLKEMSSVSADKRYELRASVSARIKSLVSRLEVYSLGLKQEWEAIARHATQTGLNGVAGFLELDLTRAHLGYPSFGIEFKNGALRQVVPDPADPSKLLQQYDLSDGVLRYGDDDRGWSRIPLHSLAADPTPEDANIAVLTEFTPAEGTPSGSS